MLGPEHRITFRRAGEDVRVDPGDVKVLGMKEVSLFPSSAIHSAELIIRGRLRMAGLCIWTGRCSIERGRGIGLVLVVRHVSFRCNSTLLARDVCMKYEVYQSFAARYGLIVVTFDERLGDK